LETRRVFQINLVDDASAVHPPVREISHHNTHIPLKELGVHVFLDKMVKDNRDDTVYFRQRSTIKPK
jgi:NADH dehydrogenase FAD-containing subunit